MRHSDCTPTTHLGDPLGQIECHTEAYLKTPEGQAEVEALARELRGESAGCVYVEQTCGGDLSAGRRDIMEIAQQLLEESKDMEQDQQTTEGITREDVKAAMAELGIFDIKPDIPLETAVSGHEIVAIARRLRVQQAQIDGLKDAVRVLGGMA